MHLRQTQISRLLLRIVP